MSQLSVSVPVVLPQEPDELTELMIQIRRHLHMYPEIGFKEFETADYIGSVLEAYGLPVAGPLAHTGSYVDIEGDLPGETVAYRADIDALPTADAKDVPYASQVDGVAHLCGHDAHTAIAIGVALRLAKMRQEIPGTVRIFFQPNEEGQPSGAPHMVKDGVLNGVSAIFTAHVDPTLEVGRFGIGAGPATAGYDAVQIRVRGASTGHSARPHHVVDTVWLASQVMNTLYQIVGRVHDARNTSILTFTMIHGGHAYNVIPDVVEFGGTLRGVDPDDQDRLLDQIRSTVHHFSSLYNAEIDVDVLRGSPPVVNDSELAKTAEESVLELYGKQALFRVPVPSMGSEDFSQYLYHIPGMMIRVGTSDGPSTSFPLHDSRFDVAEDALPLGCELVSDVLLRHLKKRAVVNPDS